MESGAINHALRFTVRATQRGYIHPATHYASSTTDPSYPPMGLRLRMKGSYSCATYSPEVQVICTALKRYGMYVADNGSDWYFTGTAENGWSEAMLDELKSVPASQFDAVDSSSLMASASSGRVRVPASAPVVPLRGWARC